MHTDSQKSVLITGASRGIGRAIATEYATAGAHVFAVARHPGNIPVDIEWIAADIATAAGLNDVISAVRNSGRTLDVLVNNAASH
jgi:NAD(P)-dependent dehydrogenase (short-subunit alcohol dehydrogenase family)